MCNLYTSTTAADAMRQLFPGRPWENRAGNLAPLPAVYPDQVAPIVLAEGEGRALKLARWGLPSPLQFHSRSGIDRGVTNVRNASSPHWRRWLGPEHRCLVPFTRFAEPVKGGNAWFALPEDRFAFFAGFHVPGWKSVRKLKDGETVDDLFAFLTCPPNAEVRAVHPKAMPVVLTEAEEWEVWLAAPWSEAKALQRPLADGSLIEERQ